MKKYLPTKRVKATHLISRPLIFSMWFLALAFLFNIEIVFFHNEVMAVVVACIGLILFVYSFIETRRGYLILELKDNQLTIKNPMLNKIKIMIDEISHIEERRKEAQTIFFIHLKDKEPIEYNIPSFRAYTKYK